MMLTKLLCDTWLISVDSLLSSSSLSNGNETRLASNSRAPLHSSENSKKHNFCIAKKYSKTIPIV